MTPMEALELAILRSMAMTHENKPGEVIRRLPAEAREALKGLTSEETRKRRHPLK